MATSRTRRSSPEPAVAVLERGNIYFSYRPKVDEQAGEGPGDVQRLYLVLGPRDKRSYRLVVCLGDDDRGVRPGASGDRARGVRTETMR